MTGLDLEKDRLIEVSRLAHAVASFPIGRVVVLVYVRESTGKGAGLKRRFSQIAVIVTDGNLRQVDDGVDWVIKTDKAVLDRMGEWCTAQHAKVSCSRLIVTSRLGVTETSSSIKSGLTEQCLASEHTHEWVTSQVLEYIKARVPDKGVAVLAGNSVHADAAFLKLEEGRGMRSVIDHLHYVRPRTDSRPLGSIAVADITSLATENR